MEALSLVAWKRGSLSFEGRLIEDLAAVPVWKLECSIVLSAEEGEVLMGKAWEGADALDRAETPVGSEIWEFDAQVSSLASLFLL